MSIQSGFGSIQHPRFHLFVGGLNQFTDFVNNLRPELGESAVVKTIRGLKCQTLDSFFKESAIELKFPSYFGENWSAFDECINDLEWLPGTCYVVCFSDTVHLISDSETDFRTLARILKATTDEWAEGRDYDSFPTPPTPFHVVFHVLPAAESMLITRLQGLSDYQVIRA